MGEPKFRAAYLAHLRLMVRLPPPAFFRTIRVPVIDGTATLPDGRTVACGPNAQTLLVPELVA